MFPKIVLTAQDVVLATKDDASEIVNLPVDIQKILLNFCISFANFKLKRSYGRILDLPLNPESDKSNVNIVFIKGILSFLKSLIYITSYGNSYLKVDLRKDNLKIYFDLTYLEDSTDLRELINLIKNFLTLTKKPHLQFLEDTSNDTPN